MPARTASSTSPTASSPARRRTASARPWRAAHRLRGRRRRHPGPAPWPRPRPAGHRAAGSWRPAPSTSRLVRQAATEQTMDSVFDLLRWPAGDFAFNVDAANPDDVGIRLAPDVVVAEAGQRQAAWDAVASVIPGPDTVLTMPVVVAVEPTVTRDEWALLALIDGHRRVGDLVELTGSGQFAVVSTLSAPRRPRSPAGQRRPGPRRHGRPPSGAARPARGRCGPGPRPQPATPSREPSRRGPSPPTSTTPQSTRPEESPPSSRTRTRETPSPTDDAARPSTSRTSHDTQASARRPRTPPAAAGADVGGPAAPRELAPLLGRAHVPGDVVPPRPEPFLPTRRPDHPEAPAARLTGLPAMNQSVSSAAVATEPETSGLIERDPSVNRSLLLRLIAGVRGL